MRSLEIADECLQQIKKSGECYIEDFELETIKYDLEFLKVLIEHLSVVEEQFDVDEVINKLVLNDINEATDFKTYKTALEYINKYGVNNVYS